jgi:ribonuclease P/MRP protein subunit RPP1
MTYYESCIHSLPEGSDSPSRLAFVARRLGYGGIIICNHTGFEKFFKPEAALKVKGIEVFFGIEVMADNARSLQSRIAAARSRTYFVGVHGGSEEINKAACEDQKVDVLFHPENGRRDLGIAAAKAAQINQIAVGFDLHPLVRLRGSSRSKWLEIVRRNIALARKFELATIITTGAVSHFDLRAPRELSSLAKMAGFEDHEINEALMYSSKILERNRKRWAGPGVEIL